MRGVCLLATLVFAATTQRSSMASALSPPAYLPELNVKSVAVSAPARAPSGGNIQLTPAGCSGAACTGFRASNTEDYSSRTNAAAFSPSSKPMMVDPWTAQVYELGTFQLTNGGYMVPADGGAGLVPMSLSLQVATKGSGKPATSLTLPFTVMWSPGSPAPPNTAGLFVLVTKASDRAPAPSQQFSVGMTPTIDFKLRLDLLGFVADAANGKDVTVLGDWGQQPPAAGEAGPRVYVKQGAPAQTVKLMGRITKID